MRRLMALAGLASVLASAACGGGDSSTEPKASYVGTYALTTLDGAPPPVTIVDDGTYHIVVTGSTLRLDANGAFAQTAAVEGTVAGLPLSQTIRCEGTFTVSGSTITFTAGTNQQCPEGTQTATLNGNTITGSLEGRTAVYKR